MELYAEDGVIPVLHSHDLTVVGSCRDFEALRHGTFLSARSTCSGVRSSESSSVQTGRIRYSPEDAYALAVSSAGYSFMVNPPCLTNKNPRQSNEKLCQGRISILIRGATLFYRNCFLYAWRDTTISPGTDVTLLVMEYSANAFDHALRGPL